MVPNQSADGAMAGREGPLNWSGLIASGLRSGQNRRNRGPGPQTIWPVRMESGRR